MDDTLTISIDFIDDQIQQYDFNEPLIGISGPQGSGKSYLTNQLYNYLQTKYHLISKLYNFQWMIFIYVNQIKINSMIPQKIHY